MNFSEETIEQLAKDHYGLATTAKSLNGYDELNFLLSTDANEKYILKILKKLFYLNFFIIVLVIFVFFQDKNQAIELFFRTNLILLFNISIFYKSKGYDIVRALDTLKMPSKVVSVFYFTLWLIDYLLMDLKKTKESLKARGFKPNTSIFTYETYGNIIAMIRINTAGYYGTLFDIDRIIRL